MTIDRTALRRLLHSWLDADQAAVYKEVPGLLDELDAGDRRIAELEAASQSVRSGAAEAVAAHDAQVARIAELHAGLSDALDMWSAEVGIRGPGEDDEYDRLCKLLPSEET